MFQDKARGEARELADMQTQATREVEALLFQMASSVAQLKRQVDGLGSARDTVDFRHGLARQNTKVQGLAKSIKDKVTLLSEGQGAQQQQQQQQQQLGQPPQAHAPLDPRQQAKAKKLVQDFAAILMDYKAVQKLAADREASCLPRAPPPPPPPVASVSSSRGGEGEGDVEAGLESQALLQKQRLVETRAMESSVAFNEALIEERDEGIAEIQRQIGEVNEMFQDLAVLINDQGQQLNTVDMHIVSTAERTREAQQQLVKADRSQRAARNKCLLLWLVAGVVFSLICIILFAT